MVQKAAVLIPRTENGEVLVVRRNFWDYSRDEQMKYAGRWCLVSGILKMTQDYASPNGDTFNLFDLIKKTYS